MSRETLLDDAIAKAKADEDWQLVEWLRMARGGESAARWYTAKLGEARLDMSKLMTENAKLRKLVRWAAMILTGIFPYVDYSRCTALEAVAAWKVEASEHGIEVDE